MLAQSCIDSENGRATEVVVSDVGLHSKFVLQHANTNRFFQGIERWTNDSDRALVFYDVQDAQYICRWLGLTDVRIVSDLDNVDRAEGLQAVA